MNIFILDRDPILAAEYLCDKHIVKMPLESFQMLSTCHYVFNSNLDLIYKPCYINHPCNIWIRKSQSNYNWLVEHTYAMHEQKLIRYEKPHASYVKLYNVLKNPPKGLEDIGLTDFVLAMPDVYKVNDPVQSYRNYYIGDKARFARWTEPAKVPYWFIKK